MVAWIRHAVPEVMARKQLVALVMRGLRSAAAGARRMVLWSAQMVRGV